MHTLVVSLSTLLLYSTILIGQSNLFESLEADISDNSLDDYSHIEAAFILSGVQSEDSLIYYVDWYDQLVSTIKDYRLDAIDRLSSARKVFDYIRTTLYDEYNEKSTTLLDIVKKRQYNCVSSTILYNLVCNDLGMFTQAFETPTHVYTIFTEFSKQVIVENTHSMGFDILKNLHVYSQYLAQFYPENQVYQIGLDRLYAYEHSKGRVINNTELLGLLAYNQAYFAMQKTDYESAYAMVLLAQDFNRDSRSNVNFEIELYYRWGEKCFKDKRYHQAFAVLADGAYRYTEEKNLIKNTRAAFINALRQDWRKKQWSASNRMIGEIFELQIIDNRTATELNMHLQNWAGYFYNKREHASRKEVQNRIDSLKRLKI